MSPYDPAARSESPTHPDAPRAGGETADAVAMRYRLAKIEEHLAFAKERGTWSDWRIGDLVVIQVPWLLEQLRSALLAPATMAIREKEAVMFRALASALPGMGKDSERLDWLNGRLNWFTTQGPGHDPQYRDIRERIDAAQTMTPEYVAARAAQPEETSADAET